MAQGEFRHAVRKWRLFASATLTVAATCRMHGLDLFAYLAEVCTASMARLTVPLLIPASA